MYSTLLLAVSLLAPPALGSPPSSTLSAKLSATLPSVSPARLPSSPAAVRGSQKIECKVVTFKTIDNLTLTADYFAPKDSKSRAPSAILVHEAGADRSQMTLFAERLNRQGLAVIVPDLRGHGASATPALDWSKLEKKERETLWAYALRDLDAATVFLESRSEVHHANLTVVGLRSGCALSVYHAGKDANVRAVVLLEPTAKPELGFDLRREIASLGGLDTKVFTPREKQGDAEMIQIDAARGNNGLEFIEIDLCKSRGKELIHDRRIAVDVAKWVEDIVFPKRGRR